MRRSTRTAAIFASGALLGSAAGIAVWLVTGFQAVWFSLLLDVCFWLGIAGLVDLRRRRSLSWRMMRACRDAAPAIAEAIRREQP